MSVKFDLSNVSIKDFGLIVHYVRNEQVSEMLTLMQRFTETDVENLPLEDFHNVLDSFSEELATHFRKSEKKENTELDGNVWDLNFLSSIDNDDPQTD